MEKDLRAKNITEYFGSEEKDLRTYSPLALAFVGDAVYSLVLRTIMIEQGSNRVDNLHRKVSRCARASYQSEMATAIADILSEEEADIYRRGRNAKSHAAPKSSTCGDYHRATGLEALIGAN